MPDNFVAQSLVETKTAKDGRRFEMTFADATGAEQTISLPSQIAVDLMPVLETLAAGVNKTSPVRFTKVPKAWAVGRAHHERLVLIRFDDDPPYGLEIDKAEDMWREMREEAEYVSRLKVPPRQ